MGWSRPSPLPGENLRGCVSPTWWIFDTLWGHRRNPEGYAAELKRFDEKLGQLMPLLGEEDLLILTADHGNDPTWKGTDHTRRMCRFLPGRRP